MSLKLYNTMSGQKEVFEPLKPDTVTMYVCGPTVYNLAHIGNATGREAEADTWLQVAQEATGDTRATDLPWGLGAKLLTAQGRYKEAIGLLRETVFDWRGDDDLSVPIYLLEYDPLFDPLRDMAGFQQLLDDYHAHLAPMRERALEAWRSGGWAALRDRAYQWARSEGK